MEFNRHVGRLIHQMHSSDNCLSKIFHCQQKLTRLNTKFCTRLGYLSEILVAELSLLISRNDP